MAQPSDRDFIQGELTYEGVGEQIGSIPRAWRFHPFPWYVAVALGFLFITVLLLAVSYLFFYGIGAWGVNVPAGWGFAIINFVWWIGIGHAGTLISAILLLMRQAWRNSINRFAEAMTLFAVMCAGMFPILHLGRPWVAYWLFPYPSAVGVWPQFRSPLVWDVFAVSTYLTVSVLFWYVGLIPDLAVMRDKAKTKLQQLVYGVFALGWRGAASHWDRYNTAYLILAGLSTPLVLSVHSIVSLDFSVSLIPGWHSTIFPPYFVAGAIFQGFAMVLILVIPVRAWYGLKNMITMRHLDWMAKLMLATGWIVAYGYAAEAFTTWYSGDKFEAYHLLNWTSGPYGWVYKLLILTNVLIPQLLWMPKMRRSIPALFLVSVSVSLGMWFERFMIVVVSLHRDFLPSSWGMYAPTAVDWGVFLGTMGFFTFMIFLFVRFVPMINIFEMKELLHRVYPARPTQAAATAGETE